MDAVLASMDKFTGAVLASSAAARLKIISRWGVGYDAIDVPAATNAGIVVAYTPGLLDETVGRFSPSRCCLPSRAACISAIST